MSQAQAGRRESGCGMRGRKAEPRERRSGSGLALCRQGARLCQDERVATELLLGERVHGEAVLLVVVDENHTATVEKL